MKDLIKRGYIILSKHDKPLVVGKKFKTQYGWMIYKGIDRPPAKSNK